MNENNNNTNINGIQLNQNITKIEKINNYYPPQTAFNETDFVDKVEEANYVYPALSITTIISCIADLIAILCGLKDLKFVGLWEILITYKLHIYLIIIAISSLTILYCLKFIINLLRKKGYKKYILKDKRIYKIFLKKCPICGKNCGGKLKISFNDGASFFICNKDETHKWKIEYSSLIDFIKK